MSHAGFVYPLAPALSTFSCLLLLLILLLLLTPRGSILSATGMQFSRARFRSFEFRFPAFTLVSSRPRDPYTPISQFPPSLPPSDASVRARTNRSFARFLLSRCLIRAGSFISPLVRFCSAASVILYNFFRRSSLPSADQFRRPRAREREKKRDERSRPSVCVLSRSWKSGT